MGAEHDLARTILQSGRGTFLDNVAGVTLEEALDAAGGYRSILGLVKHTAGWTAVYHSYAFDRTPRSWAETDWPRGLRERIDPSADYLRECVMWFDAGMSRWIASIEPPVDLAGTRPMHWGDAWPLARIVSYVATHAAYHAGEINEILAIRRGEAWEYGEHVEENHISTLGHSVRRPWITDERAAEVDAAMRAAADDRSGTR